MNPALKKAIEDGLALLPVNLPDTVALVLGAALTHMVEEIVKKHTADPAFASKVETWRIQAIAAKGGSDDDKAKASAALYQLMGS